MLFLFWCCSCSISLELWAGSLFHSWNGTLRQIWRALGWLFLQTLSGATRNRKSRNASLADSKWEYGNISSLSKAEPVTRDTNGEMSGILVSSGSLTLIQAVSYELLATTSDSVFTPQQLIYKIFRYEKGYLTVGYHFI